MGAQSRNLAHEKRRMKAAAALAEGLNPYGVLARGYAMVRDEKQVLVTSVATVTPGQKVDVTLRDGRLLCDVKTIITDKKDGMDG